MPTVNFMAWNVEVFGDPKRTRGNYAALCNIIAQAAFNQDVDILVLMELRASGVQHLSTLAHALNNVYSDKGDWYYDYIEGALDPSIGNAAVVGAAQLAMDSDHSEGYALFWNDAANANFHMLGTRVPLSAGVYGAGGPGPQRIPVNALSLVLDGRTPGQMSAGTHWFNAPAFNPAAPGNNWGQLNFCFSNPVVIGQTKRGGPRRPCYFVIEVQGRTAANGGPADRFMPFLIYHVTSNPRSRRLNTQLAGYSQPLYYVDVTPTAAAPTWTAVNNALIAGDFNIDANSRNTYEVSGLAYDAYTVFTNAFATQGANCPAWVNITSTDGNGNPNTTKTTVQLRWPLPTGQYITSNNQADYYRMAIDNIFCRAGAGVTRQEPTLDKVYGLLNEVKKNQGLSDQYAPGLISDFWTQVLTAELGAASPPYTNYPNTDPNTGCPTRTVPKNGTNVQQPIVRDVRSWPHFRSNLIAGNMTSERRAAEFVRKFISDHLPITIRLNFT
jgi:hypothetical protein